MDMQVYLGNVKGTIAFDEIIDNSFAEKAVEEVGKLKQSTVGAAAASGPRPAAGAAPPLVADARREDLRRRPARSVPVIGD